MQNSKGEIGVHGRERDGSIADADAMWGAPAGSSMSSIGSCSCRHVRPHRRRLARARAAAGGPGHLLSARRTHAAPRRLRARHPRVAHGRRTSPAARACAEGGGLGARGGLIQRERNARPHYNRPMPESGGPAESALSHTVMPAKAGIQCLRAPRPEDAGSPLSRG